MRLISFLSVIYFLLYYSRCNAYKYKPVIVLHGVMSGNASLLPFASNITEAHPGTEVYIPDVFDGWSSLLPMWHQILNIGSIVMNISSSHPDGIILIGHSQGGLIGRGILEAYPDHNVKTFISLSSPQGGQYGTKFLHLFFKNLTKSTAYRLFYSRVGQRTSVGNYWRDPHHEELYTKYSNFLPYLNNDKPSPDSIYFKSGITKLEKMILIGGPHDGVIAPWQSSQFAYFDENEKVVELKDQESYKNDALGLKTLADSNRLKMFSIPNVSHHMWHNNVTVIKKYILPYLN